MVKESIIDKQGSRNLIINPAEADIWKRMPPLVCQSGRAFLFQIDNKLFKFYGNQSNCKTNNRKRNSDLMSYRLAEARKIIALNINNIIRSYCRNDNDILIEENEILILVIYAALRSNSTPTILW